jgi:cytochrome c
MQTGWKSRAGGVALAVAVLTFGGGASAQEVTGHADAGANVFKKCLACHRIGAGAKNGVGPELNGVVGRVAGTVTGYEYSEALKTSGLTWDAATLMQWVKGPKAVVAGTKMNFLGLATDQEAADVIAYLAQYDKDGKVVPTQ